MTNAPQWAPNKNLLPGKRQGEKSCTEHSVGRGIKKDFIKHSPSQSRFTCGPKMIVWPDPGTYVCGLSSVGHLKFFGLKWNQRNFTSQEKNKFSRKQSPCEFSSQTSGCFVEGHTHRPTEEFHNRTKFLLLINGENFTNGTWRYRMEPWYIHVPHSLGRWVLISTKGQGVVGLSVQRQTASRALFFFSLDVDVWIFPHL